MNENVIVGMSGGVDSSVAALLLIEQGYDVEGLFMKNWEQDDHLDYCSAAVDLADAEAVCQQLGIKLHTVNFSKTYWDQVFEYFLSEYQQGRTPNPDVLCNREIKFKAFLDHALSLGASYIATGHYARIKKINNQPALFKAKDRNKDQTYFLHAIPHQVLSKTLFPVGELLKPQVRELALEHQLITHNRKDSTGICFIGEKRFKNFLKEFILAQPGEIHDTHGRYLGRHDGLMFYTYGQRQGLGIGGIKNAADDAWYVVDKDMQNNVLVVAQGVEHPRLYAQGLICSSIHWLMNEPPVLPLTCYAKSRYRQEDQPCLISPETAQNNHIIQFSAPQRAVTPGQFIVFYDQNRCMGGAAIEEIIR